MTFQALGKEFTLDLEPNELFSANATNVWMGRQIREQRVRQNVLYKGTVRGEPSSWARLSVRNGVIDGMIFTPEETYFVEPSQRFFRNAPVGQVLAYRMSDTESEWVRGSCALDDPHVHQAMRVAHGTSRNGTSYSGVHGLVAQLATGSYKVTELGIVADYQYYQRHGANSAADMQSIINQIDGIYQAEVGVSLQVTQTVVVTTAADSPFSATTDPSTLLSEFANYSSAAGSAMAGTDLAHLFTGRDLNGSVIGISWMGSVCRNYYDTGLSQDYTTDNKSLVLLTAHEIGHNFDAPHDNQSGSSCGTTPFGFIMNPYVSSSLNYQFSTCSKSFMSPEINAAACLSGADTTPTSSMLTAISTRGWVGTGDSVMIAGFIVSGSVPKKVLISAKGPTLADAGVASTLADPNLTLYSSTGPFLSNDDWGTAANAAELQALSANPRYAKEAAILTTLAPGAYTAIVRGAGTSTGNALVEVYDFDSSNTASRITAISTREWVGTGDNVLIGGIIISGNAPKKVLITAKGPTLAQSGVPSVLTDPNLTLYNSSGPFLSNDDWGTASNASEMQALSVNPKYAKEAAILTTLAPGAYTAIVRGAGTSTGNALVEVYEMP